MWIDEGQGSPRCYHEMRTDGKRRPSLVGIADRLSRRVIGAPRFRGILPDVSPANIARLRHRVHASIIAEAFYRSPIDFDRLLVKICHF